MDKTSDTEKKNQAETLSGYVSNDSTSGSTAQGSGNDMLNQATLRMEELWGNLLASWPAVKRNPQLASRIEELWNCLKKADNDDMILPDEIEDLINQTHSDTSYQASGEPAPGSSSAAEIDELLAEILGESYRLSEKVEAEKSGNHYSSTSTNTKYITGSKELDEMVASILGEGWEKDDTTAATEHIASTEHLSVTGHHRDVTDEWQDTPVDLKVDATSDEFDLDAVVDEILAESETTSTSQSDGVVTESVLQPGDLVPDELPPDDLLADEYTSTELSNSPALIDAEELTQFSPPESDIHDDEDVAKIISEAESALESDTNYIITGHRQDKTELDVPANEAFRVEDEKTSVIGKKHTVEANTENGLSSNRVSEISLGGLKDRKADDYVPQQPLELMSDKKNTIQRKSNNRLALALMLVLLVLIAVAGSWQYLISSDGVRVAERDTGTKAAGILDEPDLVGNELAPGMPLQDTGITETDVRDLSGEHQADSLSGVEKNSIEQNNENRYDNNEYRARIEKNENEITIVINEPLEEESVVFSNDKTDESSAGNDKSGADSPLKQKKQRASRTTKKRNIIVHTVVKGDTLWGIAKRYVNNPYKYSELARLSKIKNPDRIYPGNKVRIIKYSR